MLRSLVIAVLVTAVLASFSIIALAENSAQVEEVHYSEPATSEPAISEPATAPIWRIAATDCSNVKPESGNAGDQCKTDLDCNPGLHCTDAANAKPCTCQHLAVEEPHEDDPGTRIDPDPNPIGPGPGF